MDLLFREENSQLTQRELWYEKRTSTTLAMLGFRDTCSEAFLSFKVMTTVIINETIMCIQHQTCHHLLDYPSAQLKNPHIWA